jgi:hypothetical protein
MVYFMSEVYSRRKVARGFFDRLFEKAAPGSLFLYIDNRDTNFSGWFDDLAYTHGVKLLAADDVRLVVPPDEDKEDLGSYFDTFGYPKLTGNVSYRIARKE